MARTFTIGQHVGILTGLLAVGGPHVGTYGTVLRVVNFWGSDEYVVATDADPLGSVYAPSLLVDATDRARSMAAHPAGKGRTVRSAGGYRRMPTPIGGTYPANVPADRRSASWTPDVRREHAEMVDGIVALLAPNPWNV